MDEICSLVGTTFLYTLIAEQELGKSLNAPFVYIPPSNSWLLRPSFPNDPYYQYLMGYRLIHPLVALKCLRTWIILVKYREERLFSPKQISELINWMQSHHLWVITIFRGASSQKKIVLRSSHSDPQGTYVFHWIKMARINAALSRFQAQVKDQVYKCKVQPDDQDN